MVQINLSRGPIEGVHPFRITNVDDAFGPSGYQYLSISLRCVDEESRGLEFSTRLSFSPKSKWMMHDFLDSAGFPTKGAIDSNDLVGKLVWAEVEMRPNQQTGKLQAEVAKWLPEPENAEKFGIEEEEEEDGENVIIAELEESKDDIPF